MKLDVKERKKNALMKRDEAVVSIDHEGGATPSRKQVIAEVARLLGAKPECIIIDRITTSGGKASSEARVLAYGKKDDVPEWRLKKMEQRLSKIKPEKPAEAPKEEVPKEPEPAGEEAKVEGKPAEEAEQGGEGKPAEAQEAAEAKPAEEAPKEEGGEEKPPEETKPEGKKE